VQVGDLVKIAPARGAHRVGIITGFDSDNDPIVCWYDLEPKTGAFYHYHVEVISKNS